MTLGHYVLPAMPKGGAHISLGPILVASCTTSLLKELSLLNLFEIYINLLPTMFQVSLHVAFVHSFVNPLLFIVLHKGCRKATLDLLCCNFALPQGNLRTILSFNNFQQMNFQMIHCSQPQDITRRQVLLRPRWDLMTTLIIWRNRAAEATCRYGVYPLSVKNK